MKAHVLGNGPSIDIYTPTDGFVVGCNIQEHPVDVSVVLDCKPFLKYCGNRSIFHDQAPADARAWHADRERGLAE